MIHGYDDLDNLLSTDRTLSRYLRMDTMLRLGIGSWREKGWIFDALAMLAGWRGFADDRERRWHAMALLLLTGISASCFCFAWKSMRRYYALYQQQAQHNSPLFLLLLIHIRKRGFSHQASRSRQHHVSFSNRYIEYEE
jgi:hypothetical protein